MSGTKTRKELFEQLLKELIDSVMCYNLHIEGHNRHTNGVSFSVTDKNKLDKVMNYIQDTYSDILSVHNSTYSSEFVLVFHSNIHCQLVLQTFKKEL
jgi:hypothetical protein